MTTIDLTVGDNRKAVAVIVAIGRLRIEARGLKFKGSTLRAMQAWGFTARRKATMLAELEAWLEDHAPTSPTAMILATGAARE